MWVYNLLVHRRGYAFVTRIDCAIDMEVDNSGKDDMRSQARQQCAVAQEVQSNEAIVGKRKAFMGKVQSWFKNETGHELNDYELMVTASRAESGLMPGNISTTKYTGSRTSERLMKSGIGLRGRRSRKGNRSSAAADDMGNSGMTSRAMQQAGFAVGESIGKPAGQDSEPLTPHQRGISSQNIHVHRMKVMREGGWCKHSAGFTIAPAARGKHRLISQVVYDTGGSRASFSNLQVEKMLLESELKHSFILKIPLLMEEGTMTPSLSPEMRELVRREYALRYLEHIGCVPSSVSTSVVREVIPIKDEHMRVICRSQGASDDYIRVDPGEVPMVTLKRLARAVGRGGMARRGAKILVKDKEKKIGDIAACAAISSGVTLPNVYGVGQRVKKIGLGSRWGHVNRRERSQIIREALGRNSGIRMDDKKLPQSGVDGYGIVRDAVFANDTAEESSPAKKAVGSAVKLLNSEVVIYLFTRIFGESNVLELLEGSDPTHIPPTKVVVRSGMPIPSDRGEVEALVGREAVLSSRGTSRAKREGFGTRGRVGNRDKNKGVSVMEEDEEEGEMDAVSGRVEKIDGKEEVNKRGMKKKVRAKDMGEKRMSLRQMDGMNGLGRLEEEYLGSSSSLMRPDDEIGIDVKSSGGSVLLEMEGRKNTVQVRSMIKSVMAVKKACTSNVSVQSLLQESFVCIRARKIFPCRTIQESCCSYTC